MLAPITDPAEALTGRPNVSKRHKLIIAAVLLFATILSAFMLLWKDPALTATERQLVGRWSTPHPLVPSYVSAKGQVINPSLIWEFHQDRSYLVWNILAADFETHIPDKEGLWHAAGDRLVLEGFGDAGNALREYRELIRLKLSGVYIGRHSGEVVLRIRFLDRDRMEMTPPQGAPIMLTRRP
jgi:hypothetical protein